MSKTIDERVVEMRFDNKQFEAGVQTSLSTLDRLKKGLDLDGAAKGFDQLGTAAKKCDMSALGRSVETVQAKFSALEVVAMTALSNIANSAVNAGKRLLSSLTVEPISTGFSEYELKMGSIQTIMASTGESLDKVNQKLDELNKYSDRTIYSFSDMTSNIGKFTNAGVKLDDAVAAIQGVSNVAAVSGANANEASRAMYNFAQALSAGHVKLIDWKSIENANMATVEFKTQLLESAVAAGTLKKTANGMYKTLAKGTVIDATHMFNDSLQEQWMTTEVLTETLKDYADETTEIGKKAFAAAQDVKTWSQLLDTLKESAQSGWAETWQLVAGDYEEAKATLRIFSEFFSGIIDGSAEARNSLLEGALMSSWGQLKKRVNDTGISVDTFRDTLRETAEGSVDGLDKMIEEAGSFDAALSKGWLTTDILADTLDNLVSTAAGTQVSISELSDEQMLNIGYTQEQIDALRALSEEARSSDSDLASLVNTMDRQSGRELLFDSLLNGAKAVQGLFQTIKGAWQEIFPPATSEQLYAFIEALHSASEKIRDFFTQAEEGADGFMVAVNKPLQDIGNTFKGLFAVLDIVKQAFSALWRAVAPAGSAVGGLLTSILGLTGSFGEYLVKLDDTIRKNDIFYKGIKTVVDFIKGAISTIKEFASAIGTKLGLPSFAEAKENVKAFLDVLKERIGVPGLEALHSIFENLCTRARQVRDVITGMKDSVVDSVGRIDGAVSGNKLFQVLTGIGTLIKQVASAISGLLGKAINGLIGTISNADFNGILDFLNILAAGGVIAAIKKFLDPIDELTDTFESFKDWTKEFGGGITKILDGACGSLEAWQSKLKADALGKIAASIAVLSVSLLVLASIDSDKVTGSLAAMGVMFAELMTSMSVLDKLSIDGKSANKTASAMIKMGAALLVLGLAMKNIGELEPEQLAAGLIGVGVLLAEIDLFLNTAKFDKNASKSATGMILFAAAIKILSSAVQSLGSMDWEDLTKGLVGVGVLLAEVDIFLNTAKFNGKSMLTATGIVILAAAIKILASSCKDFGSMSWGEITKGLASIAVLLAEITAFTKLTGDAKHVISTGLALIEIAAAMKIFASAMADFGSMSWEDIAKGLVAMGVALAEITLAVNLMPKNMVGIGSGLVIVGAALKIVAGALGSMGIMSWEEIAKGLVAMGVALAELAIGLNLMNNTFSGSAALLVAAGALTVLTPVLTTLGGMSWESIIKGLIAIAGAFAVLGVAGAVLGPLAPAILALSGALTLLGVGSVAIGAGLTLIGVGLTSISVGLVSLAASLASSGTLIIGGLSAIVLGFAGLIPAIAEKIGEAIVAFCGAISSGASAIGEAVKAVVLSLVDVLVQCVPAIADGALQLVAGVLASLVAYTPQIIDSLMQFLIEVLEGIARNMPQLIQAAMDVIGAFFAGVLSALSNIDSNALIQGVAAIGLLTALTAALGLVAGLIPAAMVGVLGMGAVITELAIVLAAVGALAQIPGLEWLIGEGGRLLQTIGTAIGGFFGGIVSGFMSGVSSSFPQIGADLSSFMTNVKPFVCGASSISPDMLSGVKALTEAIVLITAADLLEGLTSWLTGGSSLSDFAEQLVPFGEAMMKFSNSISGLDGDLVSTAAIAGETLAEMAATLPNSGGVAGFFAGENDMDEFGNQLVGFGGSIMSFAQSVKGLDADAVQNAAIAGKAMAEMAATLPNTGGAVAFFTGENNMDTFGSQLLVFGVSMKAYSLAVTGLDVDAVTNSAIAGKALVELANTVPNTGGAVAFFTGDNDLAAFGSHIVVFGKAMKEYSQTVSDLDGDAVANSATVGAALVELANTVPNTGGLVSFFTGDNDLETFGEQLAPFGAGMKAYSDSLSGFDAGAVTASASAAQALAELQSTLPNVGGVVEFFVGGNDLGTFATGIVSFGEAMQGYGEAVSGLEQYSGSIEASIIAGSSLIELSKTLPNVGGVIEFFTGGNDLGTFATGIVSFGEAMQGYGEAVSGLEQYSGSIEASIIAGSSLIELSKTLPNVGGVIEFFTGGNDLGTFATGIVSFGEAMQGYGEAVSGLEDYSNSIEASVIAGSSLIELSKTLPNVGGVIEFFTGGNDLGTFGTGIKIFGEAMKDYGEAVSGLEDYSNSIEASVIAGSSLIELSKTLPNVGGVIEFFTGGNDLGAFGSGIITFGEAMTGYGEAVSGLEKHSNSIEASVIAGTSLAELAKTLPNAGGAVAFFAEGNDLATFADGIIPFGEAMRDYGVAVAGLESNSGAIEASAIAGQSLVELANTLPNCGGLAEVFTGSKSLSGFGDDIVQFGKDLSDYADAVKDVKPQVVTASANAAQALSNLANGLPDSSLFDKWFGGDQTLTSFGDDIASFGTDMSNYYSKIAGIDTAKMSEAVTQVWSLVDLAKGIQGLDMGGLSSFGTALKMMANTGISEFISAFSNSTAEIDKAVRNMLNGVSASIVNGKALTIPGMESVMKSLADTVTRKSAEINNSAAAMMRGVAASIRGSAPSVQTAVRTVLSNAATAIKGMKEQFETAGQNAGQGFVNGIRSMIGSASTAGRNLGLAALKAAQKALDSHSPSREFIHLGENMGAGLAIGAENSIVPASQATSKMIGEVIKVSAKGLDAFREWADEKKYYGELSLKDELAGYENLQKKYKAGSEERKKIDREIYRIQNELVTATYQSSLDWIEEEKYYNRLSLEEELAAYEQMQGRYMEGSDERKKIDREVYRLRNELADQEFQNFKDHLDEEEYYDRLTTQQELAYWEEVQAKYSEGTEERKEADREVYRLKKEQMDEEFQSFKDHLDEEAYYDRLTTQQELAYWEEAQAKYLEGTEERKEADRKVYALKKQQMDEEFQSFKDYLDEEKYYGRLTTQQELAYWEEVQAKYLEGTEERKEADRKVYALKKQQMDEAYQHSMDWIEKEKNYERMSLADELAAYKRVQSRYAWGTEERKEMDREVYRLEKEIYEAQEQYVQDVQDVQVKANQKRLELEQEYADKVTAINDQLAQDIQAANDKYENAVKSRADTLYGAYGLFDAVKDREESDGGVLMKNLENQVKEFGEWQDVLSELSARGLDAELIEELQQMGPDAISEIKALNSMSDPELEKYASLWSIKHAQAREQATGELENLRIETQNGIAQLRENAALELESYQTVWQQKMKQVTIDTEAELEALRTAFGKKVGLIKTDTATTMTSMSTAAQKILREAGWDTTGQQIVTGITGGVGEKKQTFLDALTNMATAGVNAVKETLDINSPSRVFMKLGNYTGLGFVKGLENYADKTYAAGSSMGESAKDGLSNAIQKLADIADSDLNMEPTIRPVLDLSGVATGAEAIDSLFESQRALELAGRASLAFSRSAGGGYPAIAVDNGDVVQELRSLRSDMTALADRMERIRIVMNTGALVGELAGPMDSALGRRMAHRERGI